MTRSGRVHASHAGATAARSRTRLDSARLPRLRWTLTASALSRRASGTVATRYLASGSAACIVLADRWMISDRSANQRWSSCRVLPLCTTMASTSLRANSPTSSSSPPGLRIIGPSVTEWSSGTTRSRSPCRNRRRSRTSRAKAFFGATAGNSLPGCMGSGGGQAVAGPGLGAEAELTVQQQDGLGHAVERYDGRAAQLRGRDPARGDAGRRQRGQQLGRVSRAVEQPDADERDLRGLLVDADGTIR